MLVDNQMKKDPRHLERNRALGHPLSLNSRWRGLMQRFYQFVLIGLFFSVLFTRGLEPMLFASESAKAPVRPLQQKHEWQKPVEQK